MRPFRFFAMATFEEAWLLRQTRKAITFVVTHRRVIYHIAVTAAVIAIVCIAVLLVIQGIGFGAGGVVAGSYAAGVQAGMGGYIAQGCLFAILQSIGALGHLTAAAYAVIVGGGLLIGVLA